MSWWNRLFAGQDEAFSPYWIDNLPTDKRGFLVPAESPWGTDDWNISGLGPEQTLALAVTDGCAVCGHPLQPGAPAYRSMEEYEMRNMAKDVGAGRVAISYGRLGHKSCMLFSSMRCPYLRSPAARLSRTTQFTAGRPRGDKACVVAFPNPYLMVPAPMLQKLATGQPTALGPFPTGVLAMANVLTYRQGEELEAEFQRAVVEDNRFLSDSYERPWRSQDECAAFVQKALARGVDLQRRAGVVVFQDVPHLMFRGPLPLLPVR